MLAHRLHRGCASRRWRRAGVGVLLASTVPVVLVGCGGGKSGSMGTTTRTTPATTTAPASAALVATLHAPGHRPKVGNWPITVTLSWQGKPASGHVSYAFLLGGQVVSRQQVGGHSPNFLGTFHDVITWPASSVGYPLTFRVVVTSPHGTKSLDYPVQVVRR